MVQKKRGRPRAFDHNAALDAATETFWRKGYDGTSLDDLTAAMGIAKPSLYGAFGDKRELFEQALARFSETTGSAAMRAFEKEQDIEKACFAFLEASLAGNTRTGDSATGCFLGTCAVAQADADPQVRSFLKRVLDLTEQKLVERFGREKDAGHLPHIDPQLAARMLTDHLQAQAYRARLGATREELVMQIPARVKSVLN